jgi:two-component sensor histidine kinase
MSEVVDAGLTVLKATYGAQIAASGPKLMVSPTAAQQLSLAIHELATNTQKYGLGLSEGGSVTVSWTADDNEFVFLWQEEREKRAKAETSPQTEGFGSKLLNSIVPAMLGGEAQRTFERCKMTYRLAAPLKAVEAHATGSDTTLLADRIIDANFGLG